MSIRMRAAAAVLAAVACSSCTPSTEKSGGSSGTNRERSGTYLSLEFSGPDTNGPLSYELSGAHAPSVSTPNGQLVINKLITDPAAWITAKENSVATCSQASLFTEISNAGTYTGGDFEFTTAIDPEGNVDGRALRSRGQPGTLTISVFNESRVEGSFETQLERTNSTAVPPPTYTVKGTFGADLKK